MLAGRALPRSGWDLGALEGHERDCHGCGEVGECPAGAEGSPQDAGDGTGGEVAEALCSGEEPEGGPADVFGGVGSDGGVFGGFNTSDADAGTHEPGQQCHPTGGVAGEAEVCDSERGDADHEYSGSAGSIARAAGGEAGEGGGDVVGDVQREGDGGGPFGGVAGFEQFAGAQNQQSCGAVAELEGANPGEQCAQVAGENWSNLEAQLSFRYVGLAGDDEGLTMNRIDGRYEPAEDRFTRLYGSGDVLEPTVLDRWEFETGTASSVVAEHATTYIAIDQGRQRVRVVAVPVGESPDDHYLAIPVPICVAEDEQAVVWTTAVAVLLDERVTQRRKDPPMDRRPNELMVDLVQALDPARIHRFVLRAPSSHR